jgi:hypothetical protein
MMNPSSRQLKGKHNLELERGSSSILKILESRKPEVQVWKTGESSFYESDLDLSRDFHRI